jgi:hypothetical protein
LPWLTALDLIFGPVQRLLIFVLALFIFIFFFLHANMQVVWRITVRAVQHTNLYDLKLFIFFVPTQIAG